MLRLHTWRRKAANFELVVLAQLWQAPTHSTNHDCRHHNLIDPCTQRHSIRGNTDPTYIALHRSRPDAAAILKRAIQPGRGRASMCFSETMKPVKHILLRPAARPTSRGGRTQLVTWGRVKVSYHAKGRTYTYISSCLQLQSMKWNPVRWHGISICQSINCHVGVRIGPNAPY